MTPVSGEVVERMALGLGMPATQAQALRRRQETTGDGQFILAPVLVSRVHELVERWPHPEDDMALEWCKACKRWTDHNTGSCATCGQKDPPACPVVKLVTSGGMKPDVHPDIQVVIDLVAQFYGYDEATLLARDRHKYVARARAVMMWIIRERGGFSFPEIGRALDNRDHTTVMTACRRVNEDKPEGVLHQARELLRLLPPRRAVLPIESSQQLGTSVTKRRVLEEAAQLLEQLKHEGDRPLTARECADALRAIAAMEPEEDG